MYKIRFNEYQYNTFLTMEFNGDKKRKLMSVYAYLIKHSENGVVTKSLNRLHKMYCRYHVKVSNKYFYNLVDILHDYELVIKECNNVRIVQEKIQKEKVVRGAKITKLKLVKKEHNTIVNNTNTSIDNNDVVAPVEVVSNISKIAKELGITKNKTIEKIEKMISAKIMKYAIKINRRGLVAYLRTAILEKYKEISFYSQLAYKARTKAKTDVYSFISNTTEYKIANLNNIALLEASACL